MLGLGLALCLHFCHIRHYDTCHIHHYDIRPYAIRLYHIRHNIRHYDIRHNHRHNHSHSLELEFGYCCHSTQQVARASEVSEPRHRTISIENANPGGRPHTLLNMVPETNQIRNGHNEILPIFKKGTAFVS